MSYLCKTCGQMHDAWPAITFKAPQPYLELKEEQKPKCHLSDDFCIIHDDGNTFYFIRTVLTIIVPDYCNDLDYGVWVSLSKKSFEDYVSNFDSDDYEAQYFGYLCTHIPGYQNTIGIKANIILSTGGNRPIVVPQYNQIENEFVFHFYHGIRKENAEKMIADVIQNTSLSN